MTTAAVLLAAGAGDRFDSPTHKLRAELDGVPLLVRSAEAMLGADFDEYVVVVGPDPFDDLIGSLDDADRLTVLPNSNWNDGQATSLTKAVEHARRRGHDVIVVGVADQPLVPIEAWMAVAGADGALVSASYCGRRRPPVRIDRTLWDELPTEGDEGARRLMRTRPDLVSAVRSGGDPDDVDTMDALEKLEQRLKDRTTVTELLGRAPQGRFDVVVRGNDGGPVVLRNQPVLEDGRPMPTTYWLCGRDEQVLVGRLESMKGVQRAEHDIGLEAIGAAHDRYRDERDRMLADLDDPPAHPPTGGVGGTRRGVKCLHAHYAWWLAGGPDPVGSWVADHLSEVEDPHWPQQMSGSGA